jgi:hypothetical protein
MMNHSKEQQHKGGWGHEDLKMVWIDKTTQGEGDAPQWTIIV